MRLSILNKSTVRTLCVLPLSCAVAALTGAALPARADPAAPAPAVVASPSGTWLTQSGNLEVAIAPCGKALCGTVVKVLFDRAMAGPGADGAGVPVTPGAATRSPLGMTILSEFKPAGNAEWKGRVFNRSNGETYDCIMSMAVGGELKLHGYKVLRLFGQTQTWTWVPGSAP